MAEKHKLTEERLNELSGTFSQIVEIFRKDQTTVGETLVVLTGIIEYVCLEAGISTDVVYKNGLESSAKLEFKPGDFPNDTDSIN